MIPTNKQNRVSRLLGAYAMEALGSFLLTLTVALSLAEDHAPPAPATAGLMLSGLVRGVRVFEDCLLLIPRSTIAC